MHYMFCCLVAFQLWCHHKSYVGDGWMQPPLLWHQTARIAKTDAFSGLRRILRAIAIKMHGFAETSRVLLERLHLAAHFGSAHYTIHCGVFLKCL
jgi:hypothetical protein